MFRKYTFITLVGLALPFWIVGAQPAVDRDALLSVGEVIELKDLLSISDLAVHGDVIYAVDGQEKKVFKYSLDGRILGSIGQEGAGPGEFAKPQRVSFFGDRMFVLDWPANVHVFEADETFSQVIRGAGIVFGSSQVILSDSSFVISGLRMENGKTDEGTLAHLYSMNGDLKRDFMPISPLVKKYRADLILGTYCDSDRSQMLWCVDTTDYTVMGFDSEGTLLRSFEIRPRDFSRMHSQAPENMRSDEYTEWSASWDAVWGLYSLTEELLLGQRQDRTRNQKSDQVVDLIRKDTGEVLASYAIEGRVIFVDTTTELVYFLLPETEDPVTRLRVVSFDDILP